MATFVDNIFSAADNAQSAVAIVEDVRQWLRQRWRLELKEGSLEALPALGGSCRDSLPPGWACVRSMRCLGHILTPNGSIGPDFEECLQQMWRAFHASRVPGLLRAPVATRARFLDSVIRPVACFRWSTWPFQATYAARLDSTQSHMLAKLVHVSPRPGEDRKAFFLRRSRFCAQILNNRARWSATWAKHYVDWKAHLDRAHDTKSWGPRLLNWHAQEWLDTLRIANWRGDNLNRLKSRAQGGRPPARWSKDCQQLGLQIGHEPTLCVVFLNPQAGSN